MKTYIGTKIIQAEPRDKNYGPAEQQGEPGYTVVYPDGYTSWSPAAAFEEAYIDMGDVSALPPHQQRVVGEKAALDAKRTALAEFFETARFSTLDLGEQARMQYQAVAMHEYSAVLGERIEAFKCA